MSKLMFGLFTALVIVAGCASGKGAVGAEEAVIAKDAKPAAVLRPPAGLGRTDDGAVLGPYGDEGAPLKIMGWRSTEAGGTVNSWLLVGASDAALIDAQLTLSQAREVVNMIRASGKSLRWVWLTHGHPDHSTGLGVIAEAFPEAKLLGHPRVAAAAPEIFEKYKKPLNRFFPGDIPDSATPVVAHEGTTLELEGVEIKVLVMEEGEAEITTALHVPKLQALFCADMVYHHVHPWLNELKVDGVRAHLDQIEALPDVKTLYPGHGEPVGKEYLATYRDYLDFFMSQVPEAKDGDDLVQRVWERYPDWRTLAGLRFSASAHIGARDEGEAP